MKEMAPDPEELHEMKLNEETYPLTEELFENDALIFDNTQIEEAWICHKDGTPYVGVKSEGFPFGGYAAPTKCVAFWRLALNSYNMRIVSCGKEKPPLTGGFFLFHSLDHFQTRELFTLFFFQCIGDRIDQI